jgi:hypothetical protein
MSGDSLDSVEERRVGVALERIAVYIEVRIKKFVGVLICQPIEVAQN